MTAGSLAAVLAVGVGCVSLPVSAFAQQRCPRPVAVIQSVKNTVELVQVSTRALQPASRLLAVCAGDTIRVGDNSRAVVLMLATNTPLAIDQNSEFTVTESSDRARTLFDLLRGAVLIITGEHRSLEVTTPFVNAAIEGTEFMVRVEADRAVITVLDGAVRASNPQGSVVVGAGQQAVAARGEAPQIQITVRPRDAVQWALYYEPILPSDSFERLAQIPEGSRDANFYVRRASLLLGVGRLDAARDDLARAEMLDPSNGDLYVLRTVVAIALNDKMAALESARAATRRAPGSAAAQVALSYALQADFDLRGARTAAESAVALEPRNAAAWARLAELQLALGDVRGASQSARRSTMLAPEAARGFAVLGFVLLAQMDMRQAQAAFEQAVMLESDNPWAHAGRGLVEIRRGHLTEGRAGLETAVALHPDNALLRSYLGKAYSDGRQDRLARAQFDAAKSLDPLDPTPWFYDGLVSQSSNQPIAALRDFERATDLNDNRAVYRSRFLLDSDLAARSARIGRTYRDLGFEQLAALEGWTSLAQDPSNASAHRLLADNYLALPQHQIARDSELLQAQLLQPINLNPVQPRLADNGLAFLDDTGIAAVGFNEFTRLFAANQVRVVEDGLGAQQGTVANNAIVSGIFNRLSYSAGQFHFDTDGIRRNNDLRQDIGDGFVQVALPGSTTAQMEVRRESLDEGDRRFLFDRNYYVTGLRNPSDGTSVRVGGAHVFGPGNTLIASYVHRDSDSTLDTGTPIHVASTQTADFGEVRYLHQQRVINLTAGVGTYGGDNSQSITVGPTHFPTSNSTVTHVNSYVYVDTHANQRLTLVTGLSVESYDNGPVTRRPVNPKLGMIWVLDDATTIRGAAFRTLKRTLISSQTLEPTEVAGFNQFVDDPNATTAWQYAVALDRRLTPDVHGGINASFRSLTTPFQDLTTRQIRETDGQERLATAYLYVTPARWLALSGQYRFDGYLGDPTAVNARLTNRSHTHTTAAEARAFAGWGGFARVRASAVDESGRFQNVRQVLFTGTDRFWVLDASAGYRLPAHRGVVALDVRNALNVPFNFQDVTPQEPAFLPDRQLVLRVTVAF